MESTRGFDFLHPLQSSKNAFQVLLWQSFEHGPQESRVQTNGRSFIFIPVATTSPTIYVIAGCNGAEKTTFAREFLPKANVVEFLNADLLAAGLSPLQPTMMAVRSARLLLARWRELLGLRRDFAFESILSGRTYAGLLRTARAAGYEVRLCFLWLPTVAMVIEPRAPARAQGRP